MPTHTIGTPPHAGLHHIGLVYSSLAEYLTVVTDFVRDGLDAREPVMVAVPGRQLELVREVLGERAELVEFHDMALAGRNPMLIIPTVLRAFVERHGTRRTRIVGEPLWPGRRPAEEWLAVRHESLINRVLADAPTTILCPWDGTGLSREVLRFAARTHPAMVEDGQCQPCAGYVEPERVIGALNDPLPDTAPVAVEVDFDRETLPIVAELLARYGDQVGLPAQRVLDLQRAVGEVAGPALAEGAEPGTLRLLDRPDRVVCEIRTPGEFHELTAGLVGAAQDSPRGRGLFAANQLCDLVETHNHPDCTTTRLYLWR